jgi:hypothetical protein
VARNFQGARTVLATSSQKKAGVAMSWILPLVCVGVMLVMMVVMCRGGCMRRCRPCEEPRDAARRQQPD